MNTLEQIAGSGYVFFLIAAAVLSLVIWFVWLVLPFTISRKLGELKAEAEKQTALLEEIAAQGRAPGAPAKPSAVSYRIPGIG